MFLFDVQADMMRAWIGLLDAGLKAMTPAGDTSPRSRPATDTRTPLPSTKDERSVPAPIFSLFPSDGKTRNALVHKSEDLSFPGAEVLAFWFPFLGKSPVAPRTDGAFNPVLSLTLAWPMMPGAWGLPQPKEPQHAQPSVSFRTASGYASATISTPIDMTAAKLPMTPWLWPFALQSAPWPRW